METIYYMLKNNDLREIEVESIIQVDGRKEVTFKYLDTDEGGNDA